MLIFSFHSAICSERLLLCVEKGLVKDCVMRISPLGVSLHEYRMYFFSICFIIFCLSEISELISKDFLLFNFKYICVAL